MTLLLLGEGASDVGESHSSREGGFRKGPMAYIIDALASGKGVKNICYTLYSRGDVAVGLKNMKRSIAPRPRDVDKEKQWFFRAACYLGNQVKAQNKDGAVFFHDPDHSKSASKRADVEIENAMRSGFMVAQCETGVPMVPNPRSEAWLMAYFQKYLPGQQPYNKAERFEMYPATDKSPNSLKTLLQRALGCDSSTEVYPRVMEEISNIDWSRVSMPSFDRFRGRLEIILCKYASANS